MVSSPPRLLSYEEALASVIANAPRLATEQVDLEGVLGRVLAEPARSATDLPAFDNSAVDGFGLHADDVARLAVGSSVSVRVVADIPAGLDPADISIRAGESVRIFTGAAVPKGVAAVAMQEDVDRTDDRASVRGPLASGAHIRRRAEELRANDVILEAGARVGPAGLAAAAAGGVARFSVFALPRIGILATGDELLSPGQEPRQGKVFESNSFGLAAAVKALGFGEARIARAGDDAVELREALANLFRTCDVVITTGGVSVGDYDLARGAFDALGVVERFWGVAVKPGKPLSFGSLESERRSISVFGLPGNPLSSMTTFHLFVVPHLLARMGADSPAPRRRAARLANSMSHSIGRLEFVPARIEERVGTLFAVTEGPRGSHRLGGLLSADAFVLFPGDVNSLDLGAEVETIDLRWSGEWL